MDPEFDWLTLDDDEEIVWADTPHPYSLLPAIAIGALFAIVLVGVVLLVGAYLSHRNTNYVITSDALYKKTGVLSRNVQRIEFEKVQDTSFRQSFLGTQFGFGTVDISTAGGGGVEMSFASVADPQAVQSMINERLRASGGRRAEDRDADEVLEEILGELRAIRTTMEGERVDHDTSNDVPDPDGTVQTAPGDSDEYEDGS